MPIYEYVCDDCSETFEVLAASSGTKVSCPKCASRKVSKQFSTFAAHSVSGGDGPCSPDQCRSCEAARSCPAGGCPLG